MLTTHLVLLVESFRLFHTYFAIITSQVNFTLNLDDTIMTLYSLSYSLITLIQFIVVPSPTVRMSFPPGLTWGRRNTEDPSQLNRLKM